MLLCWVRWEGQRAAGLCLSSIMELSTCSCLYLNMDEHRTNLNGVWWPTCKNPVLVLTHQEHLSHDGSWPQEPAPSAVTWQRRYMTAQNIFPIFGWQRLSTIHSLLAKQPPRSSPCSWAHTHVHETHANMPVVLDPNAVPLGWEEEWEHE